MGDILPLQLFQVVIRNTERLKEGTLLLGEGNKLDGNIILNGKPQTLLDTMTPIEIQPGSGTQPRY